MNQSLPVSVGIGPLLNSGGAGRQDGTAGPQSDTVGFSAMMGHAAIQTKAEVQSEKVLVKVEYGEELPTEGDSLPVSDEVSAVSSEVATPERSAADASQSMARDVAKTVAQISGFREADLSVSGRMLQPASEASATMAVQERIAALASSGVVGAAGSATENGGPKKVADTLAANSVLNGSEFKGSMVPGAVLPGSALPASVLNGLLDKNAVQSPELLVDHGAGKVQSDAANVGIPERVAASSDSAAGKAAGTTVVDNVAVGLQQGARDIVVPVDSVKAQVGMVEESVAAVVQQEVAQEQSRAMGGGASATDEVQSLSQGVVTSAASVAVEGRRDIGERSAVRAAVEADPLLRSGLNLQALDSRQPVLPTAVEADPLQRSSLNSQALDARQPVVSTTVADNKPLGDDVQSQQLLSAPQKRMLDNESDQLLKQVGERSSESLATDTKNLTKTQVLAESFAASLAGSVERSGKVTAEPQIATLPNGVKPGMPAWNQAINERIVMLSTQNGRFVEIQLDPPELGSLQVKLQFKNDQVSVVFSTPHGSVREALEQGMPRLREMFDEQGLSLADSSVDDHGAEQHSAGQRDESEQGASSYGEGDAGEGGEPVAGVEQASLSLVDYYA